MRAVLRPATPDTIPPPGGARYRHDLPYQPRFNAQMEADESEALEPVADQEPHILHAAARCCQACISSITLSVIRETVSFDTDAP